MRAVGVAAVVLVRILGLRCGVRRPLAWVKYLFDNPLAHARVVVERPPLNRLDGGAQGVAAPPFQSLR